MYVNVHGSLFIRAPNQKQPKCPSEKEQVKNSYMFHTMEYGLAVTRKYLKDIILHERKQTQRSSHGVISLI